MEREHCIFSRKGFENIAANASKAIKNEDFSDFVGMTPAEVVRRMYYYKRMYWLYRYDKENTDGLLWWQEVGWQEASQKVVINTF